jgi:hypothetical protein
MKDMFEGFNRTALGVLTFIILLILAGYSAKSDADSFNIGVGKSVINSHLKVGMVGYQINNWEFNARLMEAGPTKNGYQNQMETYSVSYITKPQWGVYGVGPYMRLGVSKNSGSSLVGDTNFMLGVGVDFNEVWRVEYVHDSSAGIAPTNTGVDAVVISYQFSPFWQ